jgi:hypothetical protein
MSWDPNKLKLCHLAAALVLGSMASAAAAEVLIVRATGPSAKNFRAGSKLADNAKFSLKQNDSLVLLDKKGTRTLRGPGNFTPTSPPQAPMATATNTKRARIGATRAPPTEQADFWAIDVARSSNVCLADTQNVALWRADTGKPMTLTVTREQDGTTSEIEWARLQDRMAWPSDMAIREGATYRLSWAGAQAPTRITFRMLPSKPEDTEAAASLLIQKGCEAQLDMLIQASQQRPEPAAAPAT